MGWVMGRASACDERCWGAQQKLCTCWCGGRYHGAGERAPAQLAKAYGLDPVDAARGVRDPLRSARQLGLFAPRRRSVSDRPTFESLAAFARERGLMA